jgi:uncharacterized protein (DUF849 family)
MEITVDSNTLDEQAMGWHIYLEVLREEVDDLHSRVNVITQQRSGGGGGEVDDEVRERVERLESRLEDVRAQVGGGGGDGLTAQQVAEAPAVKTIEERVSLLEEDVDDLDEYLSEWNVAAETYMRALRKVVEEKLDVSLASYMETVEVEGREG